MSGLGFLDAAARQASAAADLRGRPWPLPEEPWAHAETREDVVLAHWAVPEAELARYVAPALELDRFDGESWVGVVAFRAVNLRVRGLPPLPGLSSLFELEVRTYVTYGDRPGIWLLSLEATSRLLVEAAKRTHRLPAYRALVDLEADDGTISVEAQRDGRRFSARFVRRPGRVSLEAGTLDHFLNERYCLYTSDGGRLYRAELHHGPGLLREASVSIEESTLVPVSLAGTARARIAAGHDLLVWALEEL